MNITIDDVKRALAMLALEGEGTLLQDNVPDYSAPLCALLRDHLQELADRRGMQLNVTPPQLRTIDTWESSEGCWTVVNRTHMRLGGRTDAATHAPALPGVSYLPASFSGVYFGDDLQAEILRGDVTLYPPGVAVPKAALKFTPAVWWARAQLAPNAKHARACANALKGTQHGTNSEARATQREANEQRQAKADAAPPGAVRNSFGVIKPKASAVS